MRLYSWFTQHENSTSKKETLSRRAVSVTSINIGKCEMWPIALAGKSLTIKKLDKNNKSPA